jgi:hypothetical protein
MRLTFRGARDSNRRTVLAGVGVGLRGGRNRFDHGQRDRLSPSKTVWKLQLLLQRHRLEHGGGRVDLYLPHRLLGLSVDPID